MAELTHLIADYKNALSRVGPGTPQMNSLTRNGSHRSLRSRPGPSTLPHSSPSTLPHSTHHNTLNSSTHYHTTHNTLNSHTTHNTLNSHSTHNTNTLNSNSHTMTLSERNATLTFGSSQTNQSTHQSSSQDRVMSHGQPDILKSTPDHHVSPRTDVKKRSHLDSGVA